jgi:pimeloyl-ACP methyl ester carboxylesterase
MQLGMRSSFTHVHGIKLHWSETGEPSDKPALVLLHGLADCHLTWNSVACGLGYDRRVLMLDLPGHGLSERVDATYELGWYAHTVAAWLEAIGLEKLDLIGHSYGGGVCQLMMLERRIRIRRLGLVSPGGLGREVALILRLASIPQVVERCGQPFMGKLTRLVLALGIGNRLLDVGAGEGEGFSCREGGRIRV